MVLDRHPGKISGYTAIEYSHHRGRFLTTVRNEEFYLCLSPDQDFHEFPSPPPPKKKKPGESSITRLLSDIQMLII